MCNTISDISTDEKAMEAFLELSETERKTLLDVLKDIIAKIKEWAQQFTGSEHKAFMNDAEALQTLAKELNKQLKVARTQKNTADSGVVHSIENIPTENDINKNIKDIANIAPIIQLSGNEFAKGEVDLITQVSNYYDSIGGFVETPYGKIELTRTGVKSSIGHGIGRNKAIAFRAVPDVLIEGKIIDYQYNWKGRGYDTAVIAAPIKIREETYYLGAIVIVETHRNSYYLHEVAIQEKEDNSVFKTGTAKNGTPSTESSSIYTLLKRLQDVKKNSFVDTRTTKDNRHSYDDEGYRDISEDIYYPTTRREQSAFNRSLANQTSSLKNGEEKSIIINTANTLYIVKSNGFMSGEIIFRVTIDGNEDFIDSIREDELDVNTIAERFINLSKTRKTGGRRGNRSNVSSKGQRGLSKSNDRLDSGQSDSEQFGSDRSDNKDSQAKKRYSYGDEEVDLWGLLDPDEVTEESAERSQLLEGYIQTAGVLLEKTRGVKLEDGAVKRMANSVLKRFIW